jgi:hypothetical protein
MSPFGKVTYLKPVTPDAISRAENHTRNWPVGQSFPVLDLQRFFVSIVLDERGLIPCRVVIMPALGPFQ